MTEEQKEKAVHDYIVLVTAYDTTLKDHSAYGALTKGKTVCQGYAMLGFKMLEAAGLDARIVLGNATSGAKTEAHAWLLVKVHDHWYHLDPTWNDPVPDQKGRVSYDFFNLTSTQIEAKNHKITSSNLPASETLYTTDDPDILKGYRNVALTSISFTSNVIDLDIGGSTTLVPDLKPETEVDKRVTWISSNPKVAIVGPDGKITGKAIGSTTITATTVQAGSDGKSISASCQVVVKPVLITSVSISPQSQDIKTGETMSLIATLTTNASNQGLTWKSSNSTIASVDKKGTVKALKVGTVTITVTTTDGKLTDSCTVTVGKMAVTTVALNAESAQLEIGATKQLKATLTPLTATNKKVTWTSSNPSVSTVSSTGLVKAISLGQATVTVTTEDGNCIDICDITVGAKATGISLNTIAATVYPGDSVNLTVNLPQGVSVTGWSSSNLKIATVMSIDNNTASVNIPLDSLGGKVNITVSALMGKKKYTALCTITVQIKGTSLSLNKSSMDLAVGGSSSLIAKIGPLNTTNKTLVWNSSDPTVASVDAKGIVRGVKAGTATITTTAFDGMTAICEVKILEVSLTKVTIPVTLSLSLGSTKSLKAVITPTNATDKSIIWLSDNPNVVKVEANGMLTALGEGTAIITATPTDDTANAQAVTCKVTVTSGVLTTGIKISGAARINVGQSTTLKAVITPTQVSNRSLTWTSTDNSIAKVDANGTVTGLSPGTVKISAFSTDEANKGSNEFSIIISMPVSSVILNKSTSEIKVGNTDNLSATVGPDNSSNQAVIWKSSSTRIASVDNTGKVIGKGVGIAEITATTVDGKYIARCRVVVLPELVTGVSLDKTELSLNIKDSSIIKATVLTDNATNKKVSWKSSNTKVATVDRNGKIVGIGVGIVRITVTTLDGSFSASCIVTVGS